MKKQQEFQLDKSAYDVIFPEENVLLSVCADGCIYSWEKST